MVARTVGRVVVAVALVAVLAFLFVDYSAHVDDHDPYPTGEQIGTDYEAHVGELAYLWATVRSVGADSFVIETEEFVLTVRGHPRTAKPGDVVQVYGTLQTREAIDPERVVVSKQGNRTYMLVVSAVAFLLTLGLFVREWRIDLRSLAVQPRRR